MSTRGACGAKVTLGVVLQEAGIYLRGHAASLDVLDSYRVCLAPLRFGAGLKGKVVESWRRGLPVCTTSVGALPTQRNGWTCVCFTTETNGAQFVPFDMQNRLSGPYSAAINRMPRVMLCSVLCRRWAPRGCGGKTPR
jgi:hypothetical protein